MLLQLMQFSLIIEKFGEINTFSVLLSGLFGRSLRMMEIRMSFPF